VKREFVIHEAIAFSFGQDSALQVGQFLCQQCSFFINQIVPEFSEISACDKFLRCSLSNYTEECGV